MSDIKTPTAFVIGDPIKHSRSPKIHSHWLTHNGLDGQYTAIHVKPPQLEAFIDRIRDGELIGGNVTLPHKQNIAGYLDEITPTAKAIGAVNTIYWDKTEKRLIGDNTDAYGFAANLDQSAPQWRNGKTALVIGAGGAARAILYALIAAGFEKIWLTNRTAHKAEDLATAFGPKIIQLAWDNINAALPHADFVVNTTSLGMGGEGDIAIDFALAKTHTVVNDIVYIPLETSFLANARAHQLVAVDGLGMLLHQAVPGFAQWFNFKPTVDQALYDLIVADLGAH